MRLKMLPQSALKEVKVFQVLCLLDFFGEGEFSCFSSVPISFLANSGLNHSHFKKDSFKLIFLQWNGDNACRNSPLATSSYLQIEQQSLCLCLKKALFLSVIYLFLLKICIKFSYKVRKRRGCN